MSRCTRCISPVCNCSVCLHGIEDDKRPPFGVTPKFIWDEKRISDLKEAIKRYLDAGLLVNKEWIEEYNALIKFYKK